MHLDDVPISKKPRTPIGKKRRFDVFDRDKFTCQYCGRTSEEVTLEIDHIIPVSKGGGNEPENLRTSCRDCNRGKRDSEIGKEANPTDSLRRKQEMNETSELAKEVEEYNKNCTKIRDAICTSLCDLMHKTSCLKSSITGVHHAIRSYGSKRVMEWLDSAAWHVGRKGRFSEVEMMRYFYGIIRHVREEGQK